MFCTEHKQVYLFKKSASYTLEQASGGSLSPTIQT